ncbi:MAG TPA: DUF4159 domain-containing protein [bacterium]|nr:DUF4159 domain-containing protein [bacterium]
MDKEQASQRFRGASDAIDMEKLERETQKLLFLGLVVAVSFHAAIGSYFMFKRTEVKVVKPPTMELVIRRPRMTKPFEFKKKRIKQREYKKKEIVQRKPTAEIKTKSIQQNLLGNVASYEFDTKMDIDSGVNIFIPEGIDIEMTATREPEKQISMKEEMISLDDLDTGQYKAMIIQDPNDKQSVKGFIYIATLWGAQLEPSYKRAVIHLSDAVNRFTNIRSKVDKHLFVDSRKLFDTPFVFLCIDEGFQLTDIEAKNFGEYLRKGGFAVLDNGKPQDEYSSAEASLRQMLRDALGKDAKFLPISNNHPLYHCFFDFDDGPPLGSEVDISVVSEVTVFTFGRFNTFTLSKKVYFLEGITIDDRLVAIYSDKGYGIKWADTSNNEPQLKIGVNMVVFALTQEGSIAQQKMDIFSTVQ